MNWLDIQNQKIKSQIHNANKNSYRNQDQVYQEQIQTQIQQISNLQNICKLQLSKTREKLKKKEKKVQVVKEKNIANKQKVNLYKQKLSAIQDQIRVQTEINNSLQIQNEQNQQKLQFSQKIQKELEKKHYEIQMEMMKEYQK